MRWLAIQSKSFSERRGCTRPCVVPRLSKWMVGGSTRPWLGVQNGLSLVGGVFTAVVVPRLGEGWLGGVHGCGWLFRTGHFLGGRDGTRP
jgi:hypothetical protein